MARKPVKKTDGAHNHNYGFWFSDDITKWMGSPAIEKTRETSRKHFRKRSERSGI